MAPALQAAMSRAVQIFDIKNPPITLANAELAVLLRAMPFPFQSIGNDP
jgi:hypothetical protein